MRYLLSTSLRSIYPVDGFASIRTPRPSSRLLSRTNTSSTRASEFRPALMRSHSLGLESVQMRRRKHLLPGDSACIGPREALFHDRGHAPQVPRNAAAQDYVNLSCFYRRPRHRPLDEIDPARPAMLPSRALLFSGLTGSGSAGPRRRRDVIAPSRLLALCRNFQPPAPNSTQHSTQHNKGAAHE